jgi:hypothetical protein
MLGLLHTDYPHQSCHWTFLFQLNCRFFRLHVQSSTPEKWSTTEFLPTDFAELLTTTEFLSTSVFSATPEILSTSEFPSTAEFTST